jgi:type II secretory ATPase GspE/PulE/Tfp pilus assembly ATPase PilB-like protein
LKDKSSLRILRENLAIHAFECSDAIGVSADLLKLLSTSSRERNTDRRTSLKSEPMMRFRNWLEKAVEMEGSDLHLETLDSKGFVRVRAHGEMWALEDAVGGKYPAQQIMETISSVYQNLTQTASNSTAVWKPDADAYTMLNYELGGKLVKMRFQAISGNKGPKAILRIFNGSDKPSLTLPELNYEESQVAEIRKSQQTSSGLVCISGITGSGKTTTIRSFRNSSR